MPRINLKLLFLSLFVVGTLYIAFIKTEKFSSHAIIMIKDLSTKQNSSLLGSMLLGQGSSSTQDAKLLELYLLSSEMFTKLNQTFHLDTYYTSSQIDPLQRLFKNASLPLFADTPENLLKCYQKDASLLYDEASATLSLGFQHTQPKEAQKIVTAMIDTASQTLNRFEKENAKVALKALQRQEKENKQRFMEAIAKLIAYQNSHQTIDPTLDVQSKSSILATLESELIQKEVSYQSKLGYLSKNATELQLLHDAIVQLKKSIQTLKNTMAGSGENELNKNVSAFSLLQSEVDFTKELYKQTLIKLESTKIEVQQNAKNLIVVTQPTLAHTYNEPNKLKSILSLLIVLSFLYGISTLIMTILKEHKD